MTPAHQLAHALPRRSVGAPTVPEVARVADAVGPLVGIPGDDLTLLWRVAVRRGPETWPAVYHVFVNHPVDDVFRALHGMAVLLGTPHPMVGGFVGWNLERIFGLREALLADKYPTFVAACKACSTNTYTALCAALRWAPPVEA